MTIPGSLPHVNGVMEVTKELEWTNVQVDSQVLSLFMSCPFKYELVFKRQLVYIGGPSESIIRGSIIHDASLVYWKERIETGNLEVAEGRGIKVAKEKLEKEVKFDHDARLEILQNFYEFLRHIRQTPWIPIDAEKYFKIKVFEDEKLRLRIYIVGRIDVIFKSPAVAVFPVDLKTESLKWFYSEMNNQFKMYAIACGVNLLGVQRIGFQEKVDVKEKFKMETLAFDQDSLDEFRTVTLPHYVKQLIIMTEDNFFPMNTTSCIRGFFKCQFSDGNKDVGGICSVSRSIREQKIGRYFVRGEIWDPSKIED